MALGIRRLAVGAVLAFLGAHAWVRADTSSTRSLLRGVGIETHLVHEWDALVGHHAVGTARRTVCSWATARGDHGIGTAKCGAPFPPLAVVSHATLGGELEPEPEDVLVLAGVAGSNLVFGNIQPQSTVTSPVLLVGMDRSTMNTRWLGGTTDNRIMSIPVVVRLKTAIEADSRANGHGACQGLSRPMSKPRLAGDDGWDQHDDSRACVAESSSDDKWGNMSSKEKGVSSSHR